MRYIAEEVVGEELEGTEELYNIGMAAMTPPVGSVIILATEAAPNELGYAGTWEQYAKGTTLIGVDPAQVEFDTLEKTGGEKVHKLTEAELPVVTVKQNAHSHVFTIRTTAGSDASAYAFSPIGNSNSTLVAVAGSTNAATATNQPFGSGQSHNNLPPYTAVYFWLRTA